MHSRVHLRAGLKNHAKNTFNLKHKHLNSKLSLLKK